MQKEAELTGKIPPAYKTEGDIKKGFVCERVPHVTLKSIANNPDIKEGMTREAIDAAIAKHADVETLFDQLYEDKKRLRVSGPFTVESLSPHRVLSTADENQDGTVTGQEARQQQDFAGMILDNLKKAGVQNTKKNERLTFDTPGTIRRDLAQRAGDLHRILPLTPALSRKGRGSEKARGNLHRPRARHRRPAASKRSGQGSRAGRGLRSAYRLRLCLRPARG